MSGEAVMSQCNSKLPVALAALAAIFVGSSLLYAQTFPARPVRIVVPFPPGGTSDILARSIGQKLTEEWGQPVLTDNRPGAAGNIASELVAKSKPDGYTLYINTVGTHAINPAIYATLPFDVIRDFTPITNLVNLPSVMLAHPSVPVKNLKELIALAKKRPDALQYSSAGSGTQPHLTAEMFKMMSGVSILHVPYKGAGPQMIGLLSGEVALTFATAPSGVPYVKNGQLRAIGVTSARRIPALPNVQTVAEGGVAGYEAVGWNGIVAPAAMPAPLLDKIHDAITRIVRTPEINARLVDLGAEPALTTPAEFATLIKSEISKWAKVVKESGAKLD
jgi:tripartite-type tricarboxylate transporter receptor subunit TctC